MITLPKLRCLTSVTDSPNQPSMQVGKSDATTWHSHSASVSNLLPNPIHLLSPISLSTHPSSSLISNATTLAQAMTFSHVNRWQSNFVWRHSGFSQPILNFAIKVLFSSQDNHFKIQIWLFHNQSFKSIFISESGIRMQTAHFSHKQKGNFSEHQEGPQHTNRSR